MINILALVFVIFSVGISSREINAMQSIFLPAVVDDDFFNQCETQDLNPNHLVTSSGKTPLIIVCEYNLPKYFTHHAVSRLIAYGDSNPNAQDATGNTALHYACLACNLKIVQILISLHDIDPAIKNKNGLTPLNLAQQRLIIRPGMADEKTIL